jgi:CheY-like chemotaxis protein
MATDKQTILCVDDDPGVHKLLKAQLQSNNYTSHHAINGNQAIRILAQRHVDLILLDLNMPGMNGFTTLIYLKGMAETEHIPVILLSAHHREDLKIKGFEYGADDFIAKPFTGPMLLAKIKAILRRSSTPVPQPDGIHGNVKDLSIFDLLQMLTFSDKCCTVLFPEMEGKILIESGDVLFMSQSSHTGNQAFLRLLLLDQGTFSVKDNTPGDIPNPEKTPIDSLIFSTAVQIDEIKEKISNTITDSLLQLDEESNEFPDICSLKDDFPLSPQQLCSKMPGEIMDNLEQIAKALTNKVLIATD